MRCLLSLLAVPLALLLARPADAQIAPAEYAARRAALLANVGDGVVLAIGAREPAQDYLTFEQAPSFLYLTGLREPDAALVMVKRGGETRELLFVRPRDPAREVWTGTRIGVEGAARRTGIAGRAVDSLRPVLDSLLALVPTLWVVGDVREQELGDSEPRTVDEQYVELLRAGRSGLVVRAATSLVARQRGTKSAAELALIRRSAEITVRAHREAMQALEPGMNEFELQALVEYTFRRNGADRPSFATIIGSGPNATTLHYNADDRPIGGGELVVMDIGASYRGYAADVTRTIPASGTYTAEQRAIYQIVRDAQAAAERQAAPGAAARRMSDSASAVLAAGLARLGLIESPAATYDCGPKRECPQLSLFYMHGLGHGIGLEVHDPDQFYVTGRLAAGSAFTIEPGLYVRRDVLRLLPDTPRNRAIAARLAPAVTRYADIGVRIEDDYVVTERGVEWISRAPREIAEIEALMRGAYAGPAPRDAALVESYPRP